MKILRLTLIGVVVAAAFCTVGCDKSDQKKVQAEQEATKKGMRGNPGDYSPAPLNTSMTPRPTPPKTEDTK